MPKLRKGWGYGKNPLSPTLSLAPHYKDPLQQSVIIQIWIHPKKFLDRAEGDTITQEGLIAEIVSYCQLRGVTPEIRVEHPPRATNDGSTDPQAVLYVRIHNNEENRNRLEAYVRRKGFQTKTFYGLYLPGEHAMKSGRQQEVRV